MIPVLYDARETAFISLGIGKLKDAISCIVTEERNGMYELAMVYPLSGILYSQLQNDRIIKAKPNETSTDQPFRIYAISKPLGGKVTVSAEHIAYQTNKIPVFPFAASSAAEACGGMLTHSAIDNPFTFTTDKVTSGEFKIDAPVSFRSRLWGAEGSLVDVYGGGEFEFDRWHIAFKASRGRDNGVRVQYGKNLKDLRQDENISSLITGVAPYWSDGENMITLTEKVIETQSDYAYPRIDTLDLSQEFEEMPTEEELREKALSYLETTSLTTPKVSIDVSFVPLWQTENFKAHPLYEDIAGLERVSLCDTVTIRYLKLGVDAKAKVIKTVYDTLRERYDTISLGEARSNASTQAAAQQKALKEAPSKSFLAQAILNATNLITGATGGYVVLDPPTNPQRILIMDTPNKNTALKVWQWNLNGLGYSNNGINGPYETAITMDGKIVANFITAGTMSANRISGGVLQSLDGTISLNLGSSEISINIMSGEILKINNYGINYHNADGVRMGGLTFDDFDGTRELVLTTSRVGIKNQDGSPFYAITPLPGNKAHVGATELSVLEKLWFQGSYCKWTYSSAVGEYVLVQV